MHMDHDAWPQAWQHLEKEKRHVAAELQHMR